MESPQPVGHDWVEVGEAHVNGIRWQCRHCHNYTNSLVKPLSNEKIYKVYGKVLSCGEYIAWLIQNQ